MTHPLILAIITFGKKGSSFFCCCLQPKRIEMTRILHFHRTSATYLLAKETSWLSKENRYIEGRHDQLVTGQRQV